MPPDVTEVRTILTQASQEQKQPASGPSAAKAPPKLRLLPVGEFLLNNVPRFHQYPDVVRLKLGISEIYLVNNPAMIQEVLVTKQSEFMKGKFLQNTKKVFGEGLLTSEGEFHHKQRRLMQPAFHRERVKAYADVILEYEEKVTGRWRDGQVVDIHAEMTQLTMAIITKCLFDRDIRTMAGSISEDLTNVIDYFEVLASPIAGLRERLPSARTYHQAVKNVDKLVYQLIEERRDSREEQAVKTDLMSMLLAAHEEDGSGMSDSEVRDEVLITFAAGHETTSNALTWTWYLLSQNPAVEEKMLAEVDRVLGSRPPTPDDVPKLEYTTKVLTESMRIYPPAWILVREALKDTVVGGYMIPKGGPVAVSQYVVHHDSRFFPDSERFDPDRWTPEMRSALPKFAYFPFGGGARSCIGEPFAWMEGTLLLAAISRNWRMKHVEGHRVEVQPRITLRPKNGMKMRLERR